MSNLTYAQALAIANDLSAKTTKPATLLKQAVKKTGKSATFVIMRAGNPANWDAVPSITRRGRPRKEGYTPFGHKRLIGPFTLRRLDNGKTVTADTTRELVVKMGLEDTLSNQRSVGAVASGRNHSIYGWYRADILDTRVELKDQYGNEFKSMTIRQLALERGISVGSALALSTGRKRFFRGLALKTTPIDSPLKPRNWRFKGIEVKVGARTVKAKSIPALADKLGIAPADLYQMAYGFKTRPDMEIADIQIERKTALPVVD